MESGGFYRKEKDGIMLFIRLTPKAAQNAVSGVFTPIDGKTCLNIHIRAVPEKNQANKALIKFLSKTLKIAANQISLDKGQTTRFKHVLLRGDKEALQQKLAALAG